MQKEYEFYSLGMGGKSIIKIDGKENKKIAEIWHSELFIVFTYFCCLIFTSIDSFMTGIRDQYVVFTFAVLR